MNATPKFHDRKLTMALAMTAPAVRMVVVQVYANRRDDGTWEDRDHEFYPVLALVAKHQCDYSYPRKAGKYPDLAPTHDGMEAIGWAYEGCETGFDLLINDPEFGLSEASQALDVSNGRWEAVVCDWSHADDAERLAPVVARLRVEARALETQRNNTMTEAAGRPAAPNPAPATGGYLAKARGVLADLDANKKGA